MLKYGDICLMKNAGSMFDGCIAKILDNRQRSLGLGVVYGFKIIRIPNKSRHSILGFSVKADSSGWTENLFEKIDVDEEYVDVLSI